ncbi:MAG: hypothetical protein KDA76_11735 [Planctomycetaceae bacterium]|nr:hypothetical protein [Planctomycetaceae bacterium]
MIRDILREVDYSTFATLALLLFVLAFVAAGIKTLWLTSREESCEQANIPLSDGKRSDQ